MSKSIAQEASDDQAYQTDMHYARKGKKMKVITLTSTNNKEWHSDVYVFFSVTTATKKWNELNLNTEGELLHVEDTKKLLKGEDDFILHTFKDNFERKWAYELKYTEVTV